jgi:hypothetical protein
MGTRADNRVPAPGGLCAASRTSTAASTQDGRTRREIRRCLMRNLARRLYPLLIADLHHAKTIPLLT